MSGPPDKWNKYQVSTTADPNAESSSTVLDGLNADAPFNGTQVVVCSDGTYLFIGYYS
jgi:hypothetical protein